MAKQQIIYSVNKGKNVGAFVVGKLTEEFEVLATYYISESEAGGLTCSCPARKDWCRHCEILRKFQAEEKVGSGWFYNFDKGAWLPPLTSPHTEEGMI